MSFLDERQRHTLAAICDTLIPALPARAGDDPRLFALRAADLDLVSHLEKALEDATGDEEQAQLRLFLGLLENGAVNGLTAGKWAAFSRLDADARAEVLHSWANSRLPLRRTAFQGIKRPATAIFYARVPGGAPNPAWASFGYEGPPGAGGGERPIRPLEVSAPATLDCDVLVIGSGAGGGVMAGELAAAGLEVIVAEKGEYFADGNFHGAESDSMDRLYEKHGMLTTADTAMYVLAGSTLGGGTTVNWSTSLPLPEPVRREWARDYAFAAADGPQFQASLDTVMERAHVCTEESIANAQNEVLARGCQVLGYAWRVIPRNVHGCVDCSFCCFGCRYGAKQGTAKTYLQDAFQRGARILIRAHVDRIGISGDCATGAQLTVMGADGQRYPVAVRARAVVAAAGAIHTPALLRRSGLTNPNIGANLRLHPVTAILGQFDEPIYPWRGAPQSRLCDQFDDLDGYGYGVRMETAPMHPGIAALAIAWQSARQHREAMQRLDYLSNIIVLDRDRYSGRVKLDRAGKPVLDYALNAYDARHLMRGLVEALRVMRAAGARTVISAHSRYMTWDRERGQDFDRFLRDVQAQGLRPNAYGLFSAHQMGSCRIAGDARRGAVTPEGQSYEVKNLYVADGSLFPTASGVNPMITIMGLSHYIAQHIKVQMGL